MEVHSLRLYLATDPKLVGERDLCQLLEEAVAAGVTMVQLRDKQADGQALFRAGMRLRELTRRHGIPLIINDRVDVMLAVDADGVHVGARDVPLSHVRVLVPGAIVGYSVNTMADLGCAERHGADYIGVGPVFPTATKPDARDVLGLDGLARIVSRTHLPVVGIGGIVATNCRRVIDAGAMGVCVISAILGQEDVGGTAAAFSKALNGK